MTTFATLSFFEGLSEQDMNILKQFIQYRTLVPDEILFQEGEDANALYIVLSGKLEVYQGSSEEPRILGYVYPEEIVGEMGYFSAQKKRTASVRSSEETQILVVLYFSINELATRYPHIFSHLSNTMQQRESLNQQQKL